MEKLCFDEEKKPIPSVQFPYATLDPLEPDDLDPAGDREILKLAFALLLSPAPIRVAAARVAMIYNLFYPATRPVDLVKLFHGLRRDDLRDARLELASLLSAGPDEKKNAPVVAEAILTEVGTHARDGVTDA